MLRHTIRLLLLMTLVLPSWSALAQDDVEGSADHPLIKRYQGSWILGYQFHEFDEFLLPLGPMPGYDPATLEKSETVEGEWTRIIYVAPPGRSSLEVYRNYEKELKKLGFEVLYECKEGACSAGNGDALVENLLYPLGEKLGNRGQMTEYALNFTKDVRYLAAELSRPEGDVTVSLFVAIETFNNWPETTDVAMALLDVIVGEGMEEKMVVVEASQIEQSIRETGRIALYGITFDTDSTVIKPESADSLDQVVQFLTEQPAMGLYVVGHTDNEGSFDHNLDLSYRRAAAVVEWLVGKGIAADRLKAAGAGLMAPVAPNTTEEGRAKNRRVELVPQ